MRRRGTVRYSGLDLLGTHAPEGLVIAVPAIIIDRTAVFDSHRHGTDALLPEEQPIPKEDHAFRALPG